MKALDMTNMQHQQQSQFSDGENITHIAPLKVAWVQTHTFTSTKPKHPQTQPQGDNPPPTYRVDKHDYDDLSNFA